jgi:bifunctional non-homologous end joining protein LigD
MMFSAVSFRAHFTPPMLPGAAKSPPVGLQWLHEVKFDGLRAQIHIAPFNFATPASVGCAARVPARAIKIFSKRGDELTCGFGRLLPELAKLPVNDAIIDGQVVACDPNDKPWFRTPMATDHPDAPLCLWCFDLIAINSLTITEVPLEERKKLLAAILAKGTSQHIQFSDTFANPERLLETCRTAGFEGIVSKKKGSLYVGGPSRDWLKVTTAEWCAVNARSFERTRG